MINAALEPVFRYRVLGTRSDAIQIAGVMVDASPISDLAGRVVRPSGRIL